MVRLRRWGVLWACCPGAEARPHRHLWVGAVLTGFPACAAAAADPTLPVVRRVRRQGIPLVLGCSRLFGGPWDRGCRSSWAGMVALGVRHCRVLCLVREKKARNVAAYSKNRRTPSSRPNPTAPLLPAGCMIGVGDSEAQARGLAVQALAVVDRKLAPLGDRSGLARPAPRTSTVRLSSGFSKECVERPLLG